MKKLFVTFLSSILCLCMCSVSFAQESSESGFGIFPEIAGEQGTTYINLFDVILSDDCYQIWHDVCTDIVGEEAADETVSFLQGSISGTLYGDEAIDAYTEGGAAFDCWYINDVASFTFKDDTVTTTLTDGTSETHTYEYLGQYLIGDGETMEYMGEEMSVAFPCDVYQSTDEAGEFNYFFLRDDTMEDTWHIEFRYGSNLEDLQGYFFGPYAYWLSAGIDADADDETIENVITLFCTENLVSEELSSEDVIEISTAEELQAVNENLSGNYILVENIDLENIPWNPLGAFVPIGEEGEEQKTPKPEFAFTGTFDGNGHTISNLIIDRPEGYALGLFGCISGSDVGNFTLKNASANGTTMVADTIGYSHNSVVHDIILENGTVTVNLTELSTEGMYAGIVAAGMNSTISDCSAQADIIIPDGTANAGIIGGGLEMTSLSGCTATGSI